LADKVRSKSPMRHKCRHSQTRDFVFTPKLAFYNPVLWCLSIGRTASTPLLNSVFGGAVCDNESSNRFENCDIGEIDTNVTLQGLYFIKDLGTISLTRVSRPPHSSYPITEMWFRIYEYLARDSLSPICLREPEIFGVAIHGSAHLLPTLSVFYEPVILYPY